MDSDTAPHDGIGAVVRNLPDNADDQLDIGLRITRYGVGDMLGCVGDDGGCGTLTSRHWVLFPG